jgi:hypothetical protein
LIFSNTVQNFHSNNLNSINSNNFNYYVYSKQSINSKQNNILNNHSTLNLKDSNGLIPGNYIPSYTSGSTTPNHQSAKSFAVSSAALTANKSKLKHRMSASSISSTNNPYNNPTLSTTITNGNDNSVSIDNSHDYNFDSQNINSLKSSSSASLTLYTYLLQTNKNLGKDVKSSVIRSQTKKLARNSAGEFE